MGLKKAENQVKHLLGDTIVALCRNTLSHAAEINVEGLIGITLDKEEIFLVNISQTIEIPEAAAKKQEKRQSHKRQSTADQDDQSLSDESSSEDSGDQTDDSSPRKKRRRRHRRKRRSNARAQDVVGQTTRSSHVSVNAPEQTIANEGPVSNQSSLMPNISMDSSLPNVPPVIDVNPNVNQTLPQHSQGSTVDNQQGESSFTNITLQTNTGRPSSCSNDTDQNGVNVKDEVMSDDNDDEDLVIVKEEIGDNSYPNPVYIFPNVSQSLSQNESLLSPSFTNASMTSPTQSQPSAGPVPGPSNFVQSSEPQKKRKYRKTGKGKHPKKNIADILNLSPGVEEDLVAWYRDHPVLYEKSSGSSRRVQKYTLDHEKAQTLGLTGADLAAWRTNLRTQFSRLVKSGANTNNMSERDQWILNSFFFLRGHITHKT